MVDFQKNLLRFVIVATITVLLQPVPVVQADEQNNNKKNDETANIYTTTSLLRTMQLRAGVVHDPPLFDFHRKLIDIIVEMARLEDGIDLRVDIVRLPNNSSYNDAFDLIANDCLDLVNGANNNNNNHNGDIHISNEEDCHKFDIITSTYFPNPQRFHRADFTPPYSQAYVTSLKFDDKYYDDENEPKRADYSSFEEADRNGGRICALTGTFYQTLLVEKYQNAIFVPCAGDDSCVADLIDNQCDLFASTYPPSALYAVEHPEVTSTRDKINENYFVWPMSRRTLTEDQRNQLKSWMYKAITTGSIERLMKSYFALETCPVGLAGQNCTDYCDPEHGVADVRGQCICDSQKWTGNDCSIEILEDTSMIPQWQIILGLFFFAINILLCLGCAVWIYRHRHLARIQIAQPMFLGLILLGCAISSATILALMQQAEPGYTVNHCMAAPWLYSLGFSITTGTLFAKIRRTYKIFVSSAELKRVSITAWSALRDIGMILIVDIIILSVWSALDPLHWERRVVDSDKFLNPLESIGYCTSDYWPIFTGVMAGFHFLIMSVACYMCYVSRNIPESFTGGNFTAMAMFSNLQLLLLGVPVAILVGNNSEAKFFIQSAIIWINDLVVVGIIFGSLMNSIRCERRAASVRQLVQTGMDSFAKRNKQALLGKKSPYQQPTAANGNISVGIPKGTKESTTPPTTRIESWTHNQEQSTAGEGGKPSALSVAKEQLADNQTDEKEEE